MQHIQDVCEGTIMMITFSWQSVQSRVIDLSQNNILDIFNPFILDIDVATLQQTVTPGNGNEPPEDLGVFPVTTITGPPRIQVLVYKIL